MNIKSSLNLTDRVMHRFLSGLGKRRENNALSRYNSSCRPKPTLAYRDKKNPSSPFALARRAKLPKEHTTTTYCLPHTPYAA